MVKWALGALMLLNFCANADEISVNGSVPIKPNPTYTQGDFCDRRDTDYEGIRYKDKVAVCYRNVTWEIKDQVYAQYNVPRKCRKYYTVDHYVPLFMGGSNQVQNLWPEHKDIKATRQTLEQELYNRLNAGEIGQDYALRVITHAKQHPPHVVPRGCN